MSDYIHKYSALFKKIGQPSIILDGVLWTTYQRMIVPVGPVNFDYAKNAEDNRDKLLNVFKDCILIRAGSGFISESDAWYSVICDRFSDLDALSLKSRAQVRRGLRKCRVERIDTRFLAEHGWPVYSAAFRRYKNTRLSDNERQFKAKILQTEGFEDILHYWGVFEKQSDRFIAYAENYLYDKTEVNYWTISFHPDFLRLNLSNALLYEMNKYYLKDEGFSFVNNGFRNLLHKTGIQDYLINKFLYKKQPVGLKIHYRPVVGKCLSMTYPYRNVLGATYAPLRALYKLEEIRRSLDGMSK